jgi:hypothetical protein
MQRLPDLCKLAAARPQSAARHGVFPEGFKSPTELLAVIFAPHGTPAGTDAQPGSASVKDLVEPSILSAAGGSMKPEAGQPTCLTEAG